MPKTDKATEVDAAEAAYIVANACESKKANGTLILEVIKVTPLADYFVITSGDSASQVRAIVDAVEESLAELGKKPRSIEGKREARWVLMDYEDIIVHVLHEKERSHYKLEQFWNHALIIDKHKWYKED